MIKVKRSGSPVEHQSRKVKVQAIPGRVTKCNFGTQRQPSQPNMVVQGSGVRIKFGSSHDDTGKDNDDTTAYSGSGSPKTNQEVSALLREQIAGGGGRV